jgi:WD40 repeat protein
MHPTLPLCLSGGGDDRAFLWNAETGLVIENQPSGFSFKESVSATGFSHNGTYFAVGSLAGELFVGETANGHALSVSFDGPSDISWLKWHPFGDVLLVGSEDGCAWLYSIPSGKCLNVFSFSQVPLTSGAFTPDGKKIVTVSEDTTVIVWDPKSATILTKYIGQEKDQRFHAEPIRALEITLDSQMIITGSEDGTIKLSLLNVSKHVATLSGHFGSIESLAVSPIAPNILASGALDGMLNIWDLTSYKLRHTCQHPEGIVKVQFLKESNLVASSSIDGILRIWDVLSGNLVKEFKGHLDAILDMDCLTPSRLVTASDDGCCLLFAME